MASGMEMAMASVFKWLGVDPKETLQMFFAARDAAIEARDIARGVNQRLELMAVDLAELRVMLVRIEAALGGPQPLTGEAQHEHHQIGHGGSDNPPGVGNSP